MWSDPLHEARKERSRLLLHHGLRTAGFCLAFGAVAALIAGLAVSGFQSKNERAVMIIFMLCTAPAWFLALYGLYKKIDGEIAEIRRAKDVQNLYRIDAMTAPGAFLAKAKADSILTSRQTFLTPELIMQSGEIGSSILLQTVTSLDIEAFPCTKPYLLLHVKAGEEHCTYKVECSNPMRLERSGLLPIPEQAARICSWFQSYAPQCRITMSASCMTQNTLPQDRMHL